LFEHGKLEGRIVILSQSGVIFLPNDIREESNPGSMDDMICFLSFSWTIYLLSQSTTSMCTDARKYANIHTDYRKKRPLGRFHYYLLTEPLNHKENGKAVLS